jgi:hypothetical protein
MKFPWQHNKPELTQEQALELKRVLQTVPYDVTKNIMKIQIGFERN